MKHLGDITKISGYNAPVVDVITGGSPCQDLSIAGKRAGLQGERSGLFMEQIRIIKEMRERDLQNGTPINDIRPRYMVWENVPGAFSSNKGEDFRAVLEETAKVKDPTISIPGYKKWTNAGCIMGDGFSIAWRTHDAQFWGVPQRRKRISLVADFNGDTAPEILFESYGVQGDIEKGREQGEGTSEDVEAINKATEERKALNERKAELKDLEERKAKWLYYYLQSPYVKKLIQNYLNGAVQKFLPLEWLRNIDIPEYPGSNPERFPPWR